MAQTKRLVTTESNSSSISELEDGQVHAELVDDEFGSHHNNRGREFIHVFKLKLCVLLLLFCLTVAGATLVHYYISREDQNKFEYYHNVATGRLFASIGRSIDNTLGGTDALAVSLASYANLVNATWPFVTIPNFYLNTKKYAKQSHAVWTTAYHVVTADERSRWEAYTATHNDWIDQDISMQETDPNYHGPIIREREDFDVIHGWDEYYKDNPGVDGTNRTGPIYLPNWQSAPVIPAYPIYNWDILTSVDISHVEALLYSHKAVISAAYMLPDMNNEAEVEEANITADWFKDYINPEDNPMEPVSDVLYPVFRDMDSEVILDHVHHDDDHTLGAILAVSFYWRDVLRDTLPEGTSVDVVFRNECNPTFTYRLNGPTVQFLGRGDLHESKYDYLEMTTNLFHLNDFSSSKSRYTGVPINDEYCPLEISVYPAPAMEAQHKSSNPAIFTAMTVIVLSTTLFVFLSYDSQVGSRQRKTNHELEEANHKLRQASALQLRHFAMMSHEIRTPLNGILGMASLLDGDNLTLPQQESVRMIQTSGELLRTVVDDVLDYSKLAAGHQNIDIGRTDLQECLAAVIFSIETRAKLKGITLQTVFDTSVPAFILTDGRRLQQILFNLLSNAIKFSPENETVILGASVVQSENTQNLHFYVEDHGEGIPKEKFGQIFHPFAQASLQTERVYGGTGLGLSITKKLVEAMDGMIHVESELGKYARFMVDFPLRHTNDINDEETWPYEFFKKTTVHVVSVDQSTIERVGEVFRHFEVDYQVHSSLQSAQLIVKRDKLLSSPDRHNVFLVQEDLFDFTTYSHIASATKNAVLVTYGQKMLVKNCDFHFRTIEQVLPAAFMISFHQATKSFDSQAAWMKDASVRSEEVSLNQLRVLVAEDNMINQKVISRILTRVGIENVLLVENGQEAVNADAEDAFDVVLMDMEMPVMDGVEACKQIHKRVAADHEIPQIVFLTAHVTETHRKQCMEAGGVGFLSKPYNLSELTDCLHDIAYYKRTSGSPVLVARDENVAQRRPQQQECEQFPVSHQGNPLIVCKVQSDEESLESFRCEEAEDTACLWV